MRGLSFALLGCALLVSACTSPASGPPAVGGSGGGSAGSGGAGGAGADPFFSTSGVGGSAGSGGDGGSAWGGGLSYHLLSAHSGTHTVSLSASPFSSSPSKR